DAGILGLQQRTRFAEAAAVDVHLGRAAGEGSQRGRNAHAYAHGVCSLEPITLDDPLAGDDVPLDRIDPNALAGRPVDRPLDLGHVARDLEDHPTAVAG